MFLKLLQNLFHWWEIKYHVTRKLAILFGEILKQKLYFPHLRGREGLRDVTSTYVLEGLRRLYVRTALTNM